MFLAGDNDEVGREAMRQVRLRLKNDFHLDAIETHRAAPGKGSIADLEIMDLQGLIRNNLSPPVTHAGRSPFGAEPNTWNIKCPRPKRNIKSGRRLIRDMGLGFMREHGNLPGMFRLG